MKKAPAPPVYDMGLAQYIAGLELRNRQLETRHASALAKIQELREDERSAANRYEWLVTKLTNHLLSTIESEIKGESHVSRSPHTV